MVLAALIVDVVFGALGLIPDTRPSTEDVFGSIELDYKAVLNAFATLVFAALFALTVRRGATDPVCGMTVDRGTALRSDFGGRTWFFCSEHCRASFEADPESYAGGAEGDERQRARSVST
jgi:YHS domain-containing protein